MSRLFRGPDKNKEPKQGQQEEGMQTQEPQQWEQPPERQRQEEVYQQPQPYSVPPRQPAYQTPVRPQNPNRDWEGGYDYNRDRGEPRGTYQPPGAPPPPPVQPPRYAQRQNQSLEWQGGGTQVTPSGYATQAPPPQQPTRGEQAMRQLAALREQVQIEQQQTRDALAQIQRYIETPPPCACHEPVERLQEQVENLREELTQLRTLAAETREKVQWQVNETRKFWEIDDAQREELDGYRRGMQKQMLVPPMKELSRLWIGYRNLSEQAGEERLQKRLDRFFGELEALMEDCEVQRFRSTQGEALNARMYHVQGTEDTTEADLHGRVARHISDGFTMGQQVLQRAEVRVYSYQRMEEQPPESPVQAVEPVEPQRVEAWADFPEPMLEDEPAGQEQEEI